MADERVKRRLAAILAADVVGYSRLMEQDEAGTLAALKARRKNLVEPLVAQHRGRIFKVTGDGMLVEFGSALNAIECAIELQQSMTAANDGEPGDRRIVLRVGVNLGDVMVEGSDLYGDGVNIAARLESLADPGDICVSGSIYEQVRRKLGSDFDDLGPQVVKNFAEPVHVYRVRSTARNDRPLDAEALPLPAKPSIAVLPFTNLSNDPEQESFADGLTEDLITDLSRHSGLFVIARNSTFAYKGKAADVRQISRNLGVRYLLEGSARRASGRVRINVQLVDAIGGGHMWAERFDRDLADIFAVQDEVIAKIVEALVGRLVAPPARKRPTNLKAYDLCIRTRFLFGSADATREACSLLRRAIELDPGYAEAHRWLAFHMFAGWAFYGEPEEPNRRLALEAAQQAVTLDPNDAGCHWVLGYLLAQHHHWAQSDAEFAAALTLDPNHADAWAILSDLTIDSGEPADAIEQIRKALRLNPHPPGWYYWVLGQAYYAARQYELAVETLRREETYRTESRRTLAASLAQLGRMEEARREAELFMTINPQFRISKWSAWNPFRNDEMHQHFVNGYRKAGLPE